MKPEPFRLERFFAAHEFSAPYLLCGSDCESLSIGELLQMEPGAGDRFAHVRLGYTPSMGGPELRGQIASLYASIPPDGILVHSGAEEAIFNFMHVMLGPGDHVVVHAPYYQSLGEVARSMGARVSPWQGRAEDGSWELGLDGLEHLLTDRTRVVVVNFPHNPTGFLPRPAFLSELSELSDERGFVVFSDEVYRGLELDPDRRLPAFADVNPRAVSIGVMSKTYGLAGLRIGWAATQNGPLLADLAAFKDYTTICNSAPSEFLAALALRHRTAIVRRNLGIIRRNLDLLDAFFADHADLFAWRRPEAGPIAFPRYLGGPVDDFCRDLRDKAGVLLLPGTLYQKGLGDGFRIGFGRENMAAGLERLERFLDSRP